MVMYIIHSLNYVDMDNRSQSTSQVLHKLTSNDLATLVNELNPVAPERFAFGLELGLHYEQLRTIERDFHKCGDQLHEIIATRLNQGPPLTWCDVATTLRADSVGKNKLASELEDRYVNNLTMALQTDAISAQSSLMYTQTRLPTSQSDNLDTSSSMLKKYHTSVPSEYLTCSKNSAASIPQANQSPLAEGYSGSESIVRETGPPAAKRCRVESATQSDTCSVAVDRQPTNAMARIIDPLTRSHDTSSSMLKKCHTSPVSSDHLTRSKNSAARIPQANQSPLAEGYSGSDSIVRETGPPAAKRCRVESPTPCSVTVDRQPTNAMARMIEEVINGHTTQLSTLIGDDVYFTNEFIRLGIITRHSAKEIRTTCGIGNGERGRRLLDNVTTNIGGSRDRFEIFVSVFSSEPAYQELATSMTEDFRTRCNSRQFHNISESHVAHPSIDPQVVIFINHVKTLYRSKSVERDTTVVKWPPTPSEVYINLVWINRQSNSAKSKKYAEVTKAMIRDGNVDTIQNVTKGHIDFEEIAKNIRGCEPNEKRLILVEGAPGVGKSTFAWEFCRRWERGDIAQQYQLVLLLRLRDEGISKAKSLQDLIYHPLGGVAQAVCTQLALSHDFNCLIILDGFDELPASCRNEQSIVMDLISGKCLPVATVLVTSRPWATRVIHQKYGNRISQHIEILGFTSDQITRYIKSTLPQDEVSDLNAYLVRHPQIRSGMYIPLNSAIVVKVYQESQVAGSAFPTTLTELYTGLTRALLHRYMHCHPEYETATKYIGLLALLVPPKVHKNFSELCKLAYSGIVDTCDQDLPALGFMDSDSIVGTSDQVQLIFRDLPFDFDDLGFMDSVTELHVTQGTVSSYNFLHLTFQEFLAAFQISTMSEEKQIEYFRKHKDGRLKMVLRFLAGLKKLSCFSLIDNHFFQAPSTRYEDIDGLSWFSNKRRIDNPFFETPSIEHEGNSSYLMSCDVAVDIDLVHWMFEAQSDKVTLGHGTVEFYSINSLLPLDYYALGYCIVHSQCQWVLEICWDEEEMRMLVAGASTKQETTAKVVGLHLQENEISTECLNTLFTELKSLLHLHQLSLRLPEQCDSITWPDLSTLRVLDIEVNSGTKWKLDTLLSLLSLDSLTVHIYSDLVCAAVGNHIKSTSCHLKELFITSVEPGRLWIVEEEVEAITAALASNHSLPLRRLALKCECKLTDTAAESLAQFIRNTPTLNHLAIQYCTISTDGLQVLGRVITQMCAYPDDIDLSDFTIEYDGENKARDWAQLLFDYPDMVRCMNINSTASSDALTDIISDINTLNSLDELSVSNSSNDEAVALARTALHNSSIKLDLSNNAISGTGAAKLAQILCNNSTLIELHLSNNSIGDDGTAFLAKALHHNSTLNELHLSNNSIGDDGTAFLAQALHHNSTLNELDLSNNSIGDAGAAALAHALQHKFSSMKQRLCSDNIVVDDGSLALFQALNPRFSLQRLFLSENSISVDGASALAQALQHNFTMKVLDLSNNVISDGGASALAQALHYNFFLGLLDLSNNGIGDAGAVDIGQALHLNSTLKGLGLSNNSIGDAGAVVLAQALHHKSTLDWLDLSGNDGVGQEGTQQLVQALTVNRSIVLTLPRQCEEYTTQCEQYQTVKNRIQFHDEYPD